MIVVVVLSLLFFLDPQFFLSASLDGKLRLWNIPDKKVTLWNEIEGESKLITAANFIQVRQILPIQQYICGKPS